MENRFGARVRRLAPLALLVLAGLGRGQQQPAPRPPSEVLTEILAARDAASPELFEELGRRRDGDALRALERARLALRDEDALRALYAAFRHFLGAGALEERAVDFLEGEAHQELPAGRRAATRALASFGSHAHEELLAIVRDHADPECRRIAIGGILPLLHARRDAESLELLLHWYRPPLSGTRAQGVQTLGAFRGEDSLAALERALDDRSLSGTTKSMVLEALARIGGERATEIALAALGSRDGAVELAAIRALVALGWNADPRVFLRLERARDGAVRHAAFVARAALCRGDEGWSEELDRAARGRDWALRAAAADVLAEVEGEAARVALERLAADEDAVVRRSAVRALASRREQGSLALLVARMGVDSLRMRAEIRAALVELTGLDLGENPERWARWYEAEGADFELPPRAEALAAAAAREKRRDEAQTETSFYGIPIHSDRVAFVLDTSGSMSELAYRGGMRIDSVRAELLDALRALPDGARFNLVFFDDHARPWRKHLVEMDDATRAAALAHASKEGPGGGTALYDGLIAALDDPDVDTILLLSDGEPTKGAIVDPARILDDVLERNVLRQVVIHTVSVSFSSELLRDLARETGGTYIEVL